MPEKINPDITYGEKLIRLFAKLLLSHRDHSTKELCEYLECSPQTVSRLIKRIESAYSVVISVTKRGRQHYYGIETTHRKLPELSLSESEFAILVMCKSFTQHLLGKQLFDEVTHALDKSRSLLGSTEKIDDYFASYRVGTIDYTPHQNAIKTIIEAMDKHKVCKITYNTFEQADSKTFFIKPLKLFSHREALYLHAKKAKTPGEKYIEPKYDPLLAVHRIKNIELTEIDYELPDSFNFDKAFNKSFGIMKGNNFKVEVEFTGFAAGYVAERVWSPDQKIIKKRDGGIKLIFSASSEVEVVSWVLSFEDKAQIIKPKRLKDRIKSKIQQMNTLYKT